VHDLSWDLPEVSTPFSGGFSSLPLGTNSSTYELSTGNYQLLTLDLNNKTMRVTGDAAVYVIGDFTLAGSGHIESFRAGVCVFTLAEPGQSGAMVSLTTGRRRISSTTLCQVQPILRILPTAAL
jgi:hypothetical protein